MPQLDPPLSFDILDHLPQGIFIIRRNGTVAFWNHCLEDWTAIPKTVIVGNSLVTFFPHLNTHKYTSHFKSLFEGGPPATFSSQFHPQFLPCALPNGQPRIQQTIAKAIWDEPTQEWEALIIIQDISDLHHQVSESHKLRKKTQAEITERKKAKATLADQNRLLALDAEIGRIIIKNHELQPLLQECTQAIVHYLNAHFARIWTLDPTQQILELQASAGRYTHLNGPHSHVRVGQFKIGKIAEEKKPHLTNAVIGDPHVSNQEWAKQEGLLAFAGYPLLRNQEVMGVMAMFSKYPLTDLTLETLKMVGDRITLAIERQNFLKAHQELTLRYERILASAGEGIYGLDLEGQTTFVNPAAARMLGYKPEELIGLSMHPTVHHTQADGSPYPRETCPMYAAFKDGAIHHIQDEILWRKDGTWFSVEYTSMPIYDEKDQLAGAVVTFKDITERKRMEKARADLQRAIDQGAEGLALLNPKGRYVYINRAHAAMYGYTADELIGQSWKILYSKAQLTYIEETCLPQLHQSGQYHGELTGLRKNGNQFPVEISLSLLSSEEGEPTGLVCTCRDITERKEADARITQASKTLEQQNLELAATRDKALAATRSKSEFLATMSHEIRTPLNGIIGMTDLLLDTTLEIDQREMVDTVKKSGEFLLTIINDILDFSKIEAGKLNLEEINFDIRTAVDEVIDILTERAGQKNLELIGLIYATTPQQLRGDPGRIRQILFNLIGNAIKFTQEGEIVVEVSVIETSNIARSLRFAVTDTGIGIAPEVQQSLFDSFTQVDSSTTRKFGGTGLGLAICKRLVSMMQGEIGVISEQGQGSSFWFTIPLRHSSTSSPTPLPTGTLQGRRVCIVESNDTIRFLLQHYTQSWGMSCEVARNGQDGLALLQQHANDGQSFDLAILDHTLSETTQEDGLSLAKQIRQNPLISHIPLILLTAFGKRGEGKLAHQAGFNGYLPKPIRHQQLQQCLQMLLSNTQHASSSSNGESTTLITRHTVEEAQTQTQIHILLAEDNLVNQKVAVRMLHKIGYRVDIVENGKEAVEAINRTFYDLVLMDCQMPEMDGLQATQKIREAESIQENRQEAGGRRQEQKPDISETPNSLLLTPHCSRVPIIAMTANALPKDREACVNAGMDDFLAKPVRLEDLSTMITKWLPHRTTSTAPNHPDNKRYKQGSTPLPPSLDETILKDLKTLGGDDDPEFFLTVVDQFLEDLPRHREGIRQALDQQNLEALVKSAHTCKGSSRSVGATALAEISYALELMGREGILEGDSREICGMAPGTRAHRSSASTRTSAIYQASHIDPT